MFTELRVTGVNIDEIPALHALYLRGYSNPGVSIISYWHLSGKRID
jgi:hypothetical protein